MQQPTVPRDTLQQLHSSLSVSCCQDDTSCTVAKKCDVHTQARPAFRGPCEAETPDRPEQSPVQKNGASFEESNVASQKVSRRPNLMMRGSAVVVISPNKLLFGFKPAEVGLSN